MADTIESFVAKLQADGVQAGQKEAEKLRAEAQQQAEQIQRQAAAEAEKIVSEAKTEAQELLERGKTELRLAARDATLQLRDALKRVLQGVLAKGVREELTDADFLRELIGQVISLYAEAERDNVQRVEIRVPDDMKQKLADWALNEICRERDDSSPYIDLKGTLAQAGFEYSVDGATVDVTLESVVEALSNLVSPKLREVLAQAMSGQSP
jgi:V/A-type H+-transporting ATPase subunit E